MAFDHAKMVKQILEIVGGEANVEGLTHCIIRLCFMLGDTGLPKDSEVEKILGVLRVIRQGGQYQVVIGSEVIYMSAELQKLGDFSGRGRAENGDPKGNLFSRLCTFVTGYMREYERKSVN